MRRTILAALFVLSSAAPAAAWSEDGHRIVGAIAGREMRPGPSLLADDRAPSFAEAGV